MSSPSPASVTRHPRRHPIPRLRRKDTVAAALDTLIPGAARGRGLGRRAPCRAACLAPSRGRLKLWPWWCPPFTFRPSPAAPPVGPWSSWWRPVRASVSGPAVDPPVPWPWTPGLREHRSRCSVTRHRSAARPRPGFSLAQCSRRRARQRPAQRHPGGAGSADRAVLHAGVAGRRQSPATRSAQVVRYSSWQDPGVVQSVPDAAGTSGGPERRVQQEEHASLFGAADARRLLTPDPVFAGTGEEPPQVAVGALVRPGLGGSSSLKHLRRQHARQGRCTPGTRSASMPSACGPGCRYW